MYTCNILLSNYEDVDAEEEAWWAMITVQPHELF